MSQTLQTEKEVAPAPKRNVRARKPAAAKDAKKEIAAEVAMVKAKPVTPQLPPPLPEAEYVIKAKPPVSILSMIANGVKPEVVDKKAARAAVALKAKKETPAPVAGEAKTATVTKKPGTFELAVGYAINAPHYGLKAAIANHVKMGNLIKTDRGIELTEQGKAKFFAERVAKAPEMFQQVAKFINGEDTMPQWKGHPAVVGATSKTFPSPVFWDKFSKPEMRLAFAALWAK